MTKLKCDVCFHNCNLSENQIGICKARQNHNGKIISINYGLLTAMQLDPVVKKPLNFFYPEKNILSVGSFGCNLNCAFCQNSDISMQDINSVPTQSITPKELALKAQELVPSDNIGVAYTYNEPLIGYEFVRDTAKEVQKLDLKNVVVTNGSVNINILEEILPYIDAFNIDLKGFTEEYYSWLGGDFNLVKDFIELAYQHSHIELTTLIVPGKNDSIKEMQRMSDWIASLDPDIPLHLSRFFPRHNYMESAPTNIKKLFELQQVAQRKLNRVVLGNV